MKILSLDLATTSGYAFYNNDGSGSLHTGIFRLSGETHGEKYCYLYTTLEGMFNQYQPDLIVYEGRSFHGKGFMKAQFLQGLCAITELFCEKKKVAYYPIYVVTWHKRIFDKGRMTTKESKKLSKAYFESKLSKKPLDDNEADAYGILVCAAGDQDITL